MQAVQQLPLIKWSDKCQIWKLQTTDEQAPKSWNQAGVPLLWRESKSEELFAALLQNHSVQQVVDLTCGSGRLASSCLQAGIKYWGLAEGPVHQAWLGNILDQRSLRLITVEGHVLWQQSLAELIKAHFTEIAEAEDSQDAKQVDDADQDDDALEEIEEDDM